MALPRKFLNEDEELLAELRPHWIFLFGPLFTSIGVWAGLIVLVILWQSAPSWTNWPILILAVIPGLWLLGRFVRWRSYVVALTSTRILVRQGIVGRDTVQLRLQRITEVNIRQELIERVLGTGSLIIDVQGEDDSLTLEYMRKPAVVQTRHQLADQRDRGRRSPRGHSIGYATAGSLRRALCRPGRPTTPATTTRTTTTRRTRPPSVSVGPPPTRAGGHPGRRQRRVGRPCDTGHSPVRDTGPAHRARRPAPPRHPLRGGVRSQEERVARSHLRAALARVVQPPCNCEGGVGS